MHVVDDVIAFPVGSVANRRGPFRFSVVRDWRPPRPTCQVHFLFSSCPHDPDAARIAQADEGAARAARLTPGAAAPAPRLRPSRACLRSLRPAMHVGSHDRATALVHLPVPAPPARAGPPCSGPHRTARRLRPGHRSARRSVRCRRGAANASAPSAGDPSVTTSTAFRPRTRTGCSATSPAPRRLAHRRTLPPTP